MVFGLLLIGIVVILSRPPAHAPGDLRYWVYAGDGKDWSAEAAREKPAAEFFHGASFLLTNFCVMGESTGWPSAFPVLGKRFFWRTSYAIDEQIDPGQLAEAYRWIKRSADHGFAPAIEAEKLFIGKVGPPTQAVPQTGDLQH